MLRRVKASRRAVIDVGTNSIKLLVADVKGDDVTPVFEASKQTRLGRGLYKTRRLQPASIAATARIIGEFAQKAIELEAAPTRVIATSAAREAMNSAELIEAVESAAPGLKLEIISGEQEADWVFQGAARHLNLGNAPVLLVDVGGGSSEFILGAGEEKHFRRSFDIGAVRMLESCEHSDPPEPRQLQACRRHIGQGLQTTVQPALGLAVDQDIGSTVRRSLRLIATGGTAVCLAAMELKLNKFDREKLEAVRVNKTRVTWHVEHLWALPLEQRRLVRGLPADRADIMLAGAVILEQIMAVLGFDVLQVSTRGLRFAAILE